MHGVEYESQIYFISNVLWAEEGRFLFSHFLFLVERQRERVLSDGKSDMECIVQGT